MFHAQSESDGSFLRGRKLGVKPSNPALLAWLRMHG